ncbi:MAG: hypothetical protein ACR2G5_12710, partial [Pyrinomonadaceae bacterium]
LPKSAKKGWFFFWCGVAPSFPPPPQFCIRQPFESQRSGIIIYSDLSAASEAFHKEIGRQAFGVDEEYTTDKR